MQIDGGGGGGTQVELRRPGPAFAKPLDAPPAAGGERRRGVRGAPAEESAGRGRGSAAVSEQLDRTNRSSIDFSVSPLCELFVKIFAYKL